MREHLIVMLVMMDIIRLELIFVTLWCISATDTKDQWRALRVKSEELWKDVVSRVVEFPRKDVELTWLVRREFMEIFDVSEHWSRTLTTYFGKVLKQGGCKQ